MKPKTMILMGLAITCGLGASYMTSRLLADRQTEEKETVDILVAKKPLTVGTRFDKPEEVFEKKTILKENDNNPDAIRDFDALKGKILKQPRSKGDAISQGNLYAKGENLDIPDGHQAVGLKVNLETSVSGLATLPGSRVELIWFQRGPNNETSRADVLLQDVFVLAADGKVERDGITAVAQVVTLALTPEQVLFVNLAKETGIINLSLRKTGDHSAKPPKGLTGDELRAKVQGHKTTEPAEAASPEPAPKTIAKAATVIPEASNKPSEDGPKNIEQPKTQIFGLTIINGSTQSRVEYDEHGRTIRQEAEESRPRPQTTPRPQPTPRPENPQQDI